MNLFLATPKIKEFIRNFDAVDRQSPNSSVLRAQNLSARANLGIEMRMASTPKRPAGVIVLAAGKGTRMYSALPKVLSKVAGEPMIVHILRRIREASPQTPVQVVVGFGRELVEAELRTRDEFKSLDLSFAFQAEQLGTGDAARAAMETPWGERMVKEKREILVLPGDQPTLVADLVHQMIESLTRGSALRLLTVTVPNAQGYGRIVRRGKSGPVLKIVEDKDALPREKAIREVNTSIYLFDAAFLRAGLKRLTPKNAQKEFYLTDLVRQAAQGKKRIEVLPWENWEDLRGVNTPWELAEAGRILNDRVLQKWALKGVRFLHPASTLVEDTVTFEPDVEVGAGTVLGGRTTVAMGAIIGPHCVVRDSVIGPRVDLRAGCVVERSEIDRDAKLGPYAHLRPESVVGPGAKIGNFVELKKARIGADTSVAHLSYLGDAEVGARVNIGCGFVTCNFDGRTINGSRKHKTVIEDDVFMGSDCQVVAPIKIGRGAYVASGSTITKSVDPDALAFARTRQTEKPGYAKRLRAQMEESARQSGTQEAR
jgi:bifunctional UDP-N-acetylglucosamine pyrophosphorylase/glucosamine-1-phosphate N-acetyltransferase